MAPRDMTTVDVPVRPRRSPGRVARDLIGLLLMVSGTVSAVVFLWFLSPAAAGVVGSAVVAVVGVMLATER